MKTSSRISSVTGRPERLAGQIIRIPVTPLGKPRMTQRDKWQVRPTVMAYRAYCDELRLRLPRYELPEELKIVFHLPMPKSWSARHRAQSYGQRHDQKPDIDNLVKGFMDAFKAEDKHVAILHAEKYWAVEGGIIIFP